ncbi:MAG TPA: cytochrome c oxidase subunit II [Gaiellaceae bacterium]
MTPSRFDRRSPIRRQGLVLALATLASLLLAGAALASNGGLAPQPPKSPGAGRIDHIYWLLIAISGAIFVLVEGALILFVIRFRSRGRSRLLEGPQIHGATRLELIWTGIPVVILAAIVAFVLVELPGIKNVPAAGAGTKQLTVKVEGRQFYWNFIYPNGVVQVGRMPVPADRVVRLEITSPDVDHSWWIPSLDGQFDAIPGQTNHTWFKVHAGTYLGQCGEFCGYQHPTMKAAVVAIPGPQFDRWLKSEASAQQNGTSKLGQETYQGVCATCHGFRGEGGVGKTLAGNPITAQAAAIRTLLQNGRGKMPAVGRGWGDRQLNALIVYLRRFAPGGSGGH